MEWLLTLATAIALVLLFAASEGARRHGLPAEATRRLTHALGAGTVAVFPLYLRLHDVLALSLAFTAFLVWTWRRGRLSSVHGVTRPTAGALLFPSGLALAALVGWSHPVAFSLAALVLALADPAAALAGEHLTGPGWEVPGGNKTAAGSLAFFVVSFLLAIVFSTVVGHSQVFAATLVALLLTVLEGSLGYGLDNLPLPAATVLLGVTFLGL